MKNAKSIGKLTKNEDKLVKNENTDSHSAGASGHGLLGMAAERPGVGHVKRKVGMTESDTKIQPGPIGRIDGESVLISVHQIGLGI